MGGMERIMAGFANYLVNRPDTNVYLVLLLKEERFYNLDKHIKIIEPAFFLKEMPRWKYAMRMLFWLRSYIKKINPDTILSLGEYWNSFMLVATFGLSYPKFISDRSNPIDNMNFIHETIRRIIYKTATGFIAQTELAASIIMKKTGLSNYIVTGNPIRNIHVDSNLVRNNVIINVGRLIPLKQQARLIKIFARIPFKEWRLKILGNGGLYNDLKLLIESKQLQNRVELLGKVKDVDPYLHDAKIFAFTSNYEGFPNALAEGMAAGLAPISFDCPSGPSDLIQDGVNGYLIPLDDDEIFFKRLMNLINDENLINKFGANAKVSMLKYDETKVNDSVFKFILNRELFHTKY
jgi:glycosyltransferase involved in cell wall biosynthesis